MESFPVQSPEISVEDDDDDSPESARDRKDNREEDPKAAATASREEEKAEPERLEEKEIVKPENQEGEIPLEALADDELRMVAQQYIDDRTEALKNELAAAPENSPDEAAALANATMLEAIEAKLSEGETPGEQTVNEAVADTAQELDIEGQDTEDQPQINEAETQDIPEESEEAEDQPDPTDPAVAAPAAQATPPSPPSPNNPVIPGAPGPGPIPGNPAGGGGNNNLPPLTPARGYGGVPPFNPNYNANNPVANPNAPAPNAPNVPENVIVKHNAAAPYLLLGYLIGRRRGRIKTEEKLLPVQKKLEKEVSDLHKNIAAGEEKIRKLAREKAEATPGAAAKMAERIEERKKIRAEETATTETSKTEKETKIKPEKLGMLAVTKETPAEKPEPAPATEKKPKTPEPLKAPERPKDPVNMSVAELLVIAAHIPLEQGSVKKLYEKNLLTEQGLREVTQAYLRGERYETVVHKNRISAESPEQKNYETNPSVNRREVNKTPGKSYGDDAQANQTRGASQTAQSSAGAAAGSSSQPGSDTNIVKPSSRTAATALITAAVLAAIVLLLFLLRR